MDWAQGPPTLHQRCLPGTSACSLPAELSTRLRLAPTGGSCGSAAWVLASRRMPCPGTHRPQPAMGTPVATRSGQARPQEKILFRQKPKSPRTSEGFFSFCRDQVDLVFGILEHLEADVV